MSKGYYKCECGKEFTEPQRFNGHKSHCKVHMQANNKVNKLIEAQDCRKETLRKTCSQKAEKLLKQKQAKQDLEKQIWIQAQHRCENCGEIMTEKYGSGRFCSIWCAHSFSSKHNHSSDNKEIICSICGKKIYVNGRRLHKHHKCEDCLKNIRISRFQEIYGNQSIDIISQKCLQLNKSRDIRDMYDIDNSPYRDFDSINIYVNANGEYFI